MFKQEVLNVKIDEEDILLEATTATESDDIKVKNEDIDELKNSNILPIPIQPQWTVDTFIRGILKEQELNRIDLADNLSSRSINQLTSTLLRLTYALDGLIQNSIIFSTMPMPRNIAKHSSSITIGNFISGYLQRNNLTIQTIGNIMNNKKAIIQAIYEITTMIHLLYFEGIQFINIPLPQSLYYQHTTTGIQ